MALTQTTQPPLSFSKRIHHKLRRIGRLTKGYIRNMKAYKAYRKYRHHITGPLRMARADILREDHQEQKKAQQVQQKHEQEKWNQSSSPVPLHSLTNEPLPEQPVIQVQPVTLPLCGGSPVQVQYPGQFAGYQPIIKRPDITDVLTQRGGRRTVRLQHLIEPEVLPDEVKPTAEHDLFLLDQPVQADPDATVKREAIKKVS